MAKPIDNLEVVTLCSSCKLYQIKCEGFYGINGIVMEKCPYKVGLKSVVPSNAKIPYPIKEKKVRRKKK